VTKSYKFLYSILIMSLSFFSCRQPSLDLKELENSDQILLDFSFNTSENGILDRSYTAVIEGQTVYISLKPGLNRSSLTPRFNLHGKGLQVDGVWQVSGQSSHDFSQPVYYDLIRSDNSIVQYSVVTGYGDLSSTQLSGFTFKSSLNTSLGSTVNGLISGDKIVLKFPFETTVGSMIPTFYAPAGAVVSYDGVVLASDTGPMVNPSDGGILKIVFADGSSRIYRFEVNIESQNFVYVSSAGSTGASGSQKNPLNSLEEALTLAVSKHLPEIRMSAGNYSLSGNLLIDQNITIRGGYSSADWSDRSFQSPSERVNPTYQTIISTVSSSSGSANEPLGTLIYKGSSVGSSSRLEGVFINAGSGGGDITCAVSVLDGASPVLLFSDFLGNTTSIGCGIFVKDSSPSIYSSVIKGQATSGSSGLFVIDGNPEVVSCLISSDDGSVPTEGSGIDLDGISPEGRYFNNFITGRGSSKGAAVTLNVSGGKFVNNIFSNMLSWSSNYCFVESQSGARPDILKNNNFGSYNDGVPLYLKDGVSSLTTVKEINALGYAEASENVSFKFQNYLSYKNDFNNQMVPPQIVYRGTVPSTLWNRDLFNNIRTSTGSRMWSMGALELDSTSLGGESLSVTDQVHDAYDGNWSSLTLREALVIANSRDETKIITYPAGTYNCITSDSLPISSELSIIGPDGGLTLDGTGNWQHFIIDDGNPSKSQKVYLKNLNLVSGGNLTVEGGSIYSKEDLYLYNCTFTNNTAARGGAIYQDGGKLVILNSIFDANSSSSGSGGGLYITDSLFNGCNLVFTGNQALGAGANGASIYLNHSDSISSFSSFVNNSAAGSASIFSQNSANTLVVNSDFEGNTSSSLYNDVNVLAGVLNLTGSSVFTVSSFDVGPHSTGFSPGFSDISSVNYPKGPDGIWKTTDDSLHAASSGQIMVNRGNEGYISQDWPDADGDGNTTEPFPYDITMGQRILGGVVDSGAYESY